MIQDSDQLMYLAQVKRPDSHAAAGSCESGRAYKVEAADPKNGKHQGVRTVTATLINHGKDLSELGDDVIPLVVRLQAGGISPIDDVVVEGRTSDGHVRRVSIGVREGTRH